VKKPVLCDGHFLDHHNLHLEAFDQYRRLADPPGPIKIAQYKVGKSLLEPKSEDCPRHNKRAKHYLLSAFQRGYKKAGFHLALLSIKKGHIETASE
jgi:hypothetical protein